MKTRLLILAFILFSLVNFSAFGQTYNMANGTISPACSGTFYDPGGTGNYANSTGLITMTFCSGSGDEVVLDFSSFPFQVETNYDFLNIYDGVGTGGTNLWDSQASGGTTNPGVITSTTGCLTITFSSDGSVTYGGWQATISCFTPAPPTCVDGIMNGLETGVDCGGPMCPACPDCNNGIQDGNETDIDCGGSCAPCPTLCDVVITDVVVGPPIDCNGGDVELTAVGVGSFEYVLYNDFNAGAAGAGWSSTGGAAFGEPCGANPTASPYYWASTSVGTPQLTTIPFDVSCGGVVNFDMSYATQGGASPCEGPDLPNEGVTFQYSTDGGITWTTIQYWDPLGGNDPTLTSWNTYTFAIPPGAMTPNTTFQWIQNNSSGACCDNWGVDNVSITSLLDCTPYWYDWSQVPGSPDAAVQNETVGTTTTYIVTYTNGTDACYDTVTIVVPPGTSADAGPDQIFCAGSPGVLIGPDPVTPDDGATFSWNNAAGSGTIDLIPAGGITNGQVTVSPAVTTVYEVTVDFNGCQVTDQVTVVVDLPPTASNPAAINVQCTGDVPAWDVTAVTDEADDITASPAVTFVGDVSNGLSCPETITRTYRVTDGCGNFVDVTQLIIINDTQIPVMNAAPGALAVQCAGDVPAMTNLGWTDNCDGAGSLAGSDVSDGLSCPETITRTWTYTDACGNVSIAVTQTITVDDTTLPTATNPLPQIGVPPAFDPTQVTDEADNCGVPTVTNGGDVSDGGNCPEIITRTYVITDACGNSINVIQTFTIGDAIMPTASNPADDYVQCIGDVPAWDVTVVIDEADNGGVPVVTWESDMSDGLSCPETITRLYRVTDNCGNYIFVSQSIVVLDMTPPSASAPGPASYQCIGDVPIGNPGMLISFSDNCTAVPTVAYIGDVSNGLTCPETILRSWTVTDDCGNSTQVDQLITVQDTQAPVLAAQPADLTVECLGNVPAMTNLGWTDNCDGAGSIAGVDGALVGGPCGGTITRTWTYTDACGNNATVTQTITVDDTTPPTASNPIGQSGVPPVFDPTQVTDEADNCSIPTVTNGGDVSDGGNCPEIITRTYIVTDACGNSINVVQTFTIGDPIMPTASNPIPVNVECIGDVPAIDPMVVTDEVDNGGVPVVTWENDTSDGLTCPETISRVYRITDNCGNFIFVTQTITVNDVTNPTATAPATVNVECIGDVPAWNVLDINDEADNCTVTPAVVFVGDVSDGLSCPETITRIYSVTDDCGNQIIVNQLIIVNDVTNPSGTAPASVVVECIADVPAWNVLDIKNEADNCTVNPIVAFEGDVSDGLSCPETITRTYSITDDCGNQITVDQTIIVDDITNPTATNIPSINVPGAMDVPAWNILDVTTEADNCTANPIVAFVSDVSDGNVCNGEIITRTYSVTDDCGNQILVTQEITIDAVPAPIDAGLDQTICQGELVTIVADNPWNVPIAWSPVVPVGQFDPLATTTYTVTADNLGCISMDDMTVTVAPVPVVNFSADVLSGCAPLVVTLTNTTPGITTDCVWSIGGMSLTGCTVTTTLEAGLYDVTLGTTNDFGCSSLLTYTDYIYVEAVPVAQFVPSQTQLNSYSSEVEFTNNSINATDYLWSMGDGTPSGTSVNASHTFPSEEGGSYLVELIAMSPLGCADTTWVAINVSEEVIYYIPNTFTPDGDTYNEYFKPIFTSGYDPYDYDLFIFNRWGETIWESHDSSIGWDGTYGGSLVQNGSYSWRIEFKTTETDERILISGHVNVIR
jgi:gliding motility-associated-like protein